MNHSVLAHKILPILPARVWRTYCGGQELEKWLGIPHPEDSEFPEEWVASTVKARNPEPKTTKDEGLSKLQLDTGQEISLAEVIQSNPSAFLGQKHFTKFGNNMGVLVKIIDSLNRLTIQVHPDQSFAKNVFVSEYGKTEAWYIIGGRKVAGEEPYVLLGFKPGITEQKWRQVFIEQDIPAMINCLHKIFVKPGEVYFIEGGVPHAIGSGCFLLEIQEPTDYTIRVERKTPEGKELPEFLCHQGAGFEKIFDCFHYDGFSWKETLNKWRIVPQILSTNSGAIETILIGNHHTKLFAMHHLLVNNNLQTGPEESFTIVIVISGQGKAIYGGGELDLRPADILFIPAAVGKITWMTESSITKLEILKCYPPSVD